MVEVEVETGAVYGDVLDKFAVERDVEVAAESQCIHLLAFLDKFALIKFQPTGIHRGLNIQKRDKLCQGN